MAAPPRVLVAICEGSEEIETLAPVDVLRRAGADVTLAAAGDSLTVRASRQVLIQADSLISALAIEDWDMVVIPGGPGAKNLRECERLVQILNYHKSHQKWIASICAGPVVVLKELGLIEGVRATCYPSLAEQLPGRSEERVVWDGKIITSQALGSAIEFALALVKALFGEEKEGEIARQIVFRNS
jgi:protein deglycase